MEGRVCHAYFPVRHITHAEPLVKHLIRPLMGVPFVVSPLTSSGLLQRNLKYFSKTKLWLA